MSNDIEIVGASTNNLKSVDVVLPLHKATMVVGVSGSGKSSLLADTLAAETNTRMRRFLGVHQPHLSEDDVPAFLGPLPPGVHFAQAAFRASRRTTVGTSTGIIALLRHYFTKHAEPWAEEVEDTVPVASPRSYAAWIERHYAGTLIVWTIVERWRRSDGTRAVASLRKHGLKVAMLSSETDSPDRRARGREIDLEKFRPLPESSRHLIEAVVGRVQVSGKHAELKPLLERAFNIGGDIVIEFLDGKHLSRQLQTERGVQLDSAVHRVHPEVLEPFFTPTDALLSFNSPSTSGSGACRACNGLGRARTVPADALATRPTRSMHNGAFSLWTEKNYRYVNIQHETIEGLRGVRGFSPDTPWSRLSPDAQRLILFGSGSEIVADIDRHTGKKTSVPRRFPGFVPEILRRADGKGYASHLAALLIEGPCTECRGTRWSREARALRLGHWSVQELLRLSFYELRELSKPQGMMEKSLPRSARKLAKHLHAAASAFVATGLGHVSGERGMTTLSEGESRRSRLAALLRTQGGGLTLMLDEPARALHEEDVVHLSVALAGLKRRHTLIINEHRTSLARFVDQVLELGPGPGDRGGRIVNQGSPKRLISKISQALVQRPQLAVNPNEAQLTVVGARIHTLSNVTCSIPLGRLVAITGVSGSGKSSFIRGVLIPALAQEFPDRVDGEGFAWAGGLWDSLEGASRVSSVLALEPRTPTTQRRSAVATLLGVADNLREVFGRSSEAKRLGLKPTDFGWNAGQGRCRMCLGLGEVEDGGGWVICPHCGGRRFGEEVLSVRLHGHSVADVLELSVEELLVHPLSDEVGWRPLFELLVDLDLGYLTLGRRLDRISGGEHQRIRIAQTLADQHRNGLLLVLDEPSAGLHPQDVSRLLRVLDRVVAGGANTVVVVEHNVDMIRASDWIIDFGPGGGPEGGRVVGQGRPDQVADLDSPTGRVLGGRQASSPSFDAAAIRPLSMLERNDVEASPGGARQWLKRLIGDDVSAEALDPADFDSLAVAFDDTEAAVRPYEIGGLDIEIARLLLEPPSNSSDEMKRLGQLWTETPNAHLQVHPLLEELRVWGPQIPASVIRTVRNRLSRIGLGCPLDASNSSGLTAIRAKGERFQLPRPTLPECLQRLRDALSIGGGYVELADDRQRVLGTIRTRHLDLESTIPAVAPLCPGSANLSRSHPAGRCPCCDGSGSVQTVDEKLIVARPTTDPLNEGFLSSQALGVLRGVRRSTLLPFFKRMSSEGLWSAGRSFSRLDPDERSILMHGFWSRPGHGSFLKSSRAKSEDVRSWLRWDGLIRAVLAESERSRDTEWRERLETSAKAVDCPRCQGTGLQVHTRAIQLGQQSWFEWVRTGTVKQLAQALSQVDSPNRRSHRTKDRILHCLEPLTRMAPQARLREPVADPDLLRSVFERTVHSMTQLQVLK